MAASAMYPLPDDMSLPNDPTDPMVRNAPPIPATSPARITLRYRVSLTLMPTVSAAAGCSPTARTRSPQRVLNRPTCTATIRT